MKRLTEWIDNGEDRQAVPKIDLRNNGHQRCCNKLAELEDLQEQGLLLKLPCKVGDKAYHVIEDNIANPPIYISEHEITDVSAKAVYFADDWWTFEEMREMNVFLNKEEAEAKLKEYQGVMKE